MSKESPRHGPVWVDQLVIRDTVFRVSVGFPFCLVSVYESLTILNHLMVACMTMLPYVNELEIPTGWPKGGKGSF